MPGRIDHNNNQPRRPGNSAVVRYDNVTTLAALTAFIAAAAPTTLTRDARPLPVRESRASRARHSTPASLNENQGLLELIFGSASSNHGSRLGLLCVR